MIAMQHEPSRIKGSCFFYAFFGRGFGNVRRIEKTRCEESAAVMVVICLAGEWFDNKDLFLMVQEVGKKLDSVDRKLEISSLELQATRDAMKQYN